MCTRFLFCVLALSFLLVPVGPALGLSSTVNSDVINQKREKIDDRDEGLFEVVWYISWHMGMSYPQPPSRCNQYQLFELKEKAKLEALDACSESGAKNCQIRGVVVLLNGVAKDDAESELLGGGIGKAGCAVRASAKGDF